MRVTAPYGSWPSVVTPEMLVEKAIDLSDVAVDRGVVYWVESRPEEAGRQVLVAWSEGSGTTDLLPDGFSVRSLVHEYGGRSYAARAGTIVLSNLSDQRLWLLDPGEGPGGNTMVPLTEEPLRRHAVRFADPALSPDGRLTVCVRERHDDEGVENDLVVVACDPSEQLLPPRPVASGHDFFAAPRFSPDGRRLAWLTWDHPSMPWDHTELWVAPFEDGRLGEATLVAGAHGESVSQPQFSPEGVLHYLSDQSGWWNLYEEGNRPLAPIGRDFGGPDWQFGQSSYTFLDDGTLVATWYDEAGQQIGTVQGGTVRKIETTWTSWAFLRGFGDEIVAVVGSPSAPAAVVRLEVHGGTEDVLRRSRALRIDPGQISVPERFDFDCSDGGVAHGLYYAPASTSHDGPAGTLPPLLVTVHGGPTGAARRLFNLAVQYWTSRGFALADVDYRGSSGYGRAYRERLRGAWGIADVEDCADAALALADRGLADREKLLVRGASAGGFTALSCLTFKDVFVAGASHYGVADLSLLALETHKFEARYLDGLVGPWPEAEATYAARSPLRHAERIACPVIFFQGSDDEVVPRAQSDAMVAALTERGVPVTYHVFDGERHGFKKASTIVAVAVAELAFYQSVLGLDRTGAGAPG